jgi:hypothetical protein
MNGLSRCLAIGIYASEYYVVAPLCLFLYGLPWVHKFVRVTATQHEPLNQWTDFKKSIYETSNESCPPIQILSYIKA